MGDWDKAGETEAEIVQGLHDAAYTVQVVRIPAESYAAIDSSVEPVIMIVDWQAFGFYQKDDFDRGAIYNPFWEWRCVIEDRRISGEICGLISVYHKEMVGILGWFGSPSAVSSDMVLGYPFSAKILIQFLRRLTEFQATYSEYLGSFWDDDVLYNFHGKQIFALRYTTQV